MSREYTIRLSWPGVLVTGGGLLLAIAAYVPWVEMLSPSFITGEPTVAYFNAFDEGWVGWLATGAGLWIALRGFGLVSATQRASDPKLGRRDGLVQLVILGVSAVLIHTQIQALLARIPLIEAQHDQIAASAFLGIPLTYLGVGLAAIGLWRSTEW